MVTYDVLRCDFLHSGARILVPQTLVEKDGSLLKMERLYTVKVTSLDLSKCSAADRMAWFMFGEFGVSAASM